jgi:hypothetical protein
MKNLSPIKVVLIIIASVFSHFSFSQNETEPIIDVPEVAISFDYNKELFVEKQGNVVYSSKSNAVLSADVILESFDQLKKNYEENKKNKNYAGPKMELFSDKGIEYFVLKSERYDGSDKVDVSTLIKKADNNNCIIVSCSYFSSEANKYLNEGKQAIVSAKIEK